MSLRHPLCPLGRLALFLAASGLGVAIVGGGSSAWAEPASDVAIADRAAAEAPFLDDLQQRTFRFFWERTPADNGLTPDRWPSKSASSIAAVGFALTSYGVGVERGWITREEGAERVLATLQFFRDAPQHDGPQKVTGYRGFYYHFLVMNTGHRFRTCELSSIDTALLMAGVLFAAEYFDGDDDVETELRQIASDLYRRVEWDWLQPRPPLVGMAWYPEGRGPQQQQFGRADYQGYNEAMLLYVLALGSPTHAIDPAAWDKFTSTYRWGEFHGQEHINFTPLFGHQYSHIWIDFRGIQDEYTKTKGIDYFENSRRATLSQRRYAIANPHGWRDYSGDVWGLTACDGPLNRKLRYRGEERAFHTYFARGASLNGIEDDGTIAPTAAGGSIPFAPQETLAALRAMRERYGERLYSEYGFLDSFNPSFTFDGVEPFRGEVYDDIGWVNSDYLGIDQGPILLMAENYHSELVWRVMRRNEYIRAGLERAGFTGGWLDAEETGETSLDAAAK